ncbi:hypothetical protein [Vandammella animalimorsus]|uniref:hypothetical protein n=1 Tax=Vandammella animalimorsus TaxID=2029117 RepID=UPI00117820C8|nr:hypothetical protein [Vandammella animalimorsus]
MCSKKVFWGLTIGEWNIAIFVPLALALLGYCNCYWLMNFKSFLSLFVPVIAALLAYKLLRKTEERIKNIESILNDSKRSRGRRYLLRKKIENDDSLVQFYFYVTAVASAVLFFISIHPNCRGG